MSARAVDASPKLYAKPLEEMSREERTALLTRLKAKVKFCLEAGKDQRQREIEDRRFQVAENQWEPGVREARKGQPTLAVSLTRQPLQLIQNQAANAKMGVDLHPKTSTSTAELAKIKRGLYKRIERDGRAEQARMWALRSAAVCGLGWYRINTQWDEDSDNQSDQEIVYERILDQSTVFYDPTAQRADFSDAKCIGIAAFMTAEDFRAEYPDAEIATTADFDGLTATEPEWVRSRAGASEPDPLVVELFYKEKNTRQVAIDARGGKYTRMKDETVVCRAVLTAHEILSKIVWPGRLIPFVPEAGEELQVIDGERIWEGIIRPARGAQVGFNYAISSMVADAGRLSKVPVIGPKGMFNGFEEDWREANVKNIPFLEYNLVQEPGAPPAPMPMQIDGAKMQLSLALAQEMKDLSQTATSVPSPSLGEVPKRRDARSGRAILALQQQSDASTSHFIQNHATISLPYDARVVLDLMGPIYDRPGRVEQIIGADDKTETVMLNAPFVADPDTGQPVPVPEGIPLPPEAKVYNLSEGNYGIEVSVGKTFQTQMQEGQEILGEIFAAAPELFPILGDLYVEMKQLPKGDEMARRIRAMRERDPRTAGLDDDGTGKMSPEQAQAKVRGLEQQLQAMQQQLQAAAQALQAEQQKQQAMLEKSRLDAESRERITEANNETKILIAKLEQVQKALDRRAEAEEHEKEMAHEVGLKAAEAQAVKVQREEGRDEGGERDAPGGDE